MDILISIITLSALGVIFGVGLAIAAKKLCVASDPRLEKIYANLPGANCGACGMAGCIGFAEGLIQGTCTIERCAVTDENARKDIAEIIGVQAKVKIKKSAFLHCHGGEGRVQDKFIYKGEKGCVSASLILGGPKECFYGCIGYGDCERICPFGAIMMSEEELPVVDETKCVACGKCVIACPKKLFTIEPSEKRYVVRCASWDSGKKVMEVCSVGCIACHKCQKACPLQAITIVNNMAVIDYNKCDNRGECFKACPTKAIVKR